MKFSTLVPFTILFIVVLLIFPPITVFLAGFDLAVLLCLVFLELTIKFVGKGLYYNKFLILISMGFSVTFLGVATWIYLNFLTN